MDASEDMNPEDWVDLYGDNLFRYARHRVKETAIAEELVQETFLAAIQSQDRFIGYSSFHPCKRAYERGFAPV